MTSIVSVMISALIDPTSPRQNPGSLSSMKQASSTYTAVDMPASFPDAVAVHPHYFIIFSFLLISLSNSWDSVTCETPPVSL